jgi:excinuclease ABC subunit C
MPAQSEHLQEKLRALPGKPGVYCFRDARGRALYVGKAKILRNRVRSYFQSSRSQPPRTARMVSKIADLEIIVTDSEVEALILEANLVHEYHPRYNVDLKDDKSFPYIRVTNEPYPRVFPTRKVVQNGSLYFGPYTEVRMMRKTLETLRRIFPIRSCKYRITAESIEKKKVRLCLDYHIQKCPGPCEGCISEADYGAMIEQTVSFLNGKHSAVRLSLLEQMDAASQNLQFEEAARIRDQIAAIDGFSNNQKMVLPGKGDMDIFALAREHDIGIAVIFKVRDGKMVGRLHFQLRGVKDRDESEALRAVLQQYYLHTQFVPEDILLPTPLEDTATLEKWLHGKRGGRVKLVQPKIGSKAQLLSLGEKNAQLLLDELKLQKLKREDYTPASVSELQKHLGLAQLPRHIEGFDISNISGTDAVGSMVVFENGMPKKSAYRRFKIQTVTGPDDFAMMREVVMRRYRRVQQEKLDFPDLILIDGGKGQLNAAVSALQELHLPDQPIAGLAKKFEEVFLPGMRDHQMIPKTSAGLALLQRVRDESHRFALAYHKTLRKQRTITSALEDIPGVGKQRRQALLEHFGSVKRLSKATQENIAAVKGISTELAQTIAGYVQDRLQMPSGTSTEQV